MYVCIYYVYIYLYIYVKYILFILYILYIYISGQYYYIRANYTYNR